MRPGLAATVCSKHSANACRSGLWPEKLRFTFYPYVVAIAFCLDLDKQTHNRLTAIKGLPSTRHYSVHYSRERNGVLCVYILARGGRLVITAGPGMKIELASNCHGKVLAYHSSQPGSCLVNISGDEITVATTL